MSFLSYLDGSFKASHNGFNGDYGIRSSAKPLSQMLFTPYESSADFMYCSRHTLIPALTLALIIIDPIGMAGVLGGLAGLSLVLSLTSKVCDYLGQKKLASFSNFVANYIINDVTSCLLGILALPLSTLALLTRSATSLGALEENLLSKLDPKPVIHLSPTSF